MKDLRKKLEISKDALKSLNDFLLDDKNPLINELFKIIDKYGGVEEINRKAQESSKLDNLIGQLNTKKPEYVKDLEWLIEARPGDELTSTICGPFFPSSRSTPATRRPMI